MIVDQQFGKAWAAYLGDSCEVLPRIPPNSIHLSVFSPPFAALYTYSNSERDLGNCRSDAEFFEHFGFIVAELHRALMPGRIVAFHCMNIPAMKERDGYIGLKDFRGDLIRQFERAGFIFHSEHCIWKDPLIEATRTKALGLMHKQIQKDSSMCRAGIPDYLIAMRKPGVNAEAVSHPAGITEWCGLNPPREADGNLSHNRWRRYASPVWMDIDQGRTLQKESARDDRDERHIAPLQLDVIERACFLWSNPKDVVLSPFMGIGSEGYVALGMGRRFIGIELKRSYYEQAVRNLKRAEDDSASQMSLIDFEAPMQHRPDSWMAALGAQDALHEEARGWREKRDGAEA